MNPIPSIELTEPNMKYLPVSHRNIKNTSVQFANYNVLVIRQYQQCISFKVSRIRWHSIILSWKRKLGRYVWQIPLFIVHIKVVEQILIGSCYWAIGPIYNFLPLWNTSPITIIIVWTRKEKNLLLTFRLKTECNLNILNYLSTFHHSK